MENVKKRPKVPKELKGPEHKQERRKWYKDNKVTDIPTICLEKKCRKEFLRKSVGYCKRCPECQQKIKQKKTMSKVKRKASAKDQEVLGHHKKVFCWVLKELQELIFTKEGLKPDIATKCREKKCKNEFNRMSELQPKICERCFLKRSMSKKKWKEYVQTQCCLTSP
jgi:hypothetical protein